MIQADGRAVFPSALKNSFGNGVNTKCFLVCFHISGKFLIFLTQGKFANQPFVYEWYMCGSIGMCKTLLIDVTHRSPLVRRFSSLPTFFSPSPWFQAGKELNKKWSECSADSLGPNFSHCQGATKKYTVQYAKSSVDCKHSVRFPNSLAFEWKWAGKPVILPSFRLVSSSFCTDPMWWWRARKTT